MGRSVSSHPKKIADIQSFDDCWEACQAREDCYFITYSSLKSECYLKKHDTGRLPRQGYMSGGCRIKSTFIGNYIFQLISNSQLVNVLLAVSCNDTVSDSDDSDAVVKLSDVSGNMCYDKDCPFFIEEFIKYTSNDITDGFYSIDTVSTEEECAKKCKERSDACKFFIFVREGETDSGCHLKSSDTGREVANLNYRSGGYQCLRGDQGESNLLNLN